MSHMYRLHLYRTFHATVYLIFSFYTNFFSYYRETIKITVMMINFDRVLMMGQMLR